MTTTSNGNSPPPPRRIRIDATVPERPSERLAPVSSVPGHSGRRLVGVGVLTVLALWGGLYLAFRDWRAHVRERIAYGTRQVATAVDPLDRLEPPDVDPAAWRQAVAQTRAMLVTVTSANILSLAELRDLRTEVQIRAEHARARPSTARAELTALWDDMAARAGHILDRHPRPRLLAPEDVAEKNAPGSRASVKMP